jgi:outer membrane protein TolC
MVFGEDMRISCLTITLLLGSIGFGRAQQPLALDEALRLARQNNLQLKKQEQKQKIAALEMEIKRGQLLPSLDFSAVSAYTDEIARFDIPLSQLPPNLGASQIRLGGHDRTEIAIGLRQPIFTGFRLRTQVDLAKTALESEDTRLALLNQQTAYQVHQLFYQAQSLKKERKIQEASSARLNVQLDQARSLFNAAQAMAYDTLQVYNQALQIKILLDQNQRDQRLLDLQMARLLDLPECDRYRIRPAAARRIPQHSTASNKRVQRRPNCSVLGQRSRS